MQQSWFREREKHGRTEQAKAKEKVEAKAEEQDNRQRLGTLDTRKEEAQAQVPGGTGDTTPTPTLDGKTGTIGALMRNSQEHLTTTGKTKASTTNGKNGRNLEKHKTKNHIQTYLAQKTNGLRAPQLSLRAPQQSPRASGKLGH